MVTTPELLPLLSQGKHRRPRSGACLMEFVSFLAGERWSDHPTCTHPLLGSLARMVNDSTSDGERQRLAGLAPRLIGLTSDDLRWHAVIARRAAVIAFPVAAEQRQRTLAVGVLVCERVLASLDGRSPDTLTEVGRDALARAPRAWEWAEQFSAGHDVSPDAFRDRGAPNVVRTAVVGAAEAMTRDRDGLLRSMLSDAIDECAALRATADRHERVLVA
jgi:hypothetical protein